jgi:UDPglucose 6-dehydrogenase
MIIMTEYKEPLRILIIGLGTVGSSQAYLMRKLNHEVFGYDINPTVVNEVVTQKLETEVDITFICTPESVVEDVIQQLVNNGVKGLYVIKSTTPVGMCMELMKKFNIHICHNPEFLRERYALEDVVNPSRVVIGECCKKHGDLLEQLYKPLNKPIYRTDPTTSELIKLVSNVMRCLMISFWNYVYLLSQRVGTNIEIIAEAADPGKVIGEWEGGKWGTRFFGKPYGGKCLPKDIKHLLNASRKYGINTALLEATEEINELVRSLNTGGSEVNG